MSEEKKDDINNEFSVLMSVYKKENAENFEVALKSILINQTLKPTEMILVCDGKLTNELNEVIKKYENLFSNVLKVFRLPENLGLGKALNFGLEKCSYELVARADSDDVCTEDRFDLQVAFMNQNKDISIISSYIDEFETDWNCPVNKKTMPTKNDDLIKMAKFRNPLNHMAVMFRKSFIINIGSYKHLPYVEDYELWVRAIIHGGKIANIDKVLVHARVGNGMVARRGNREYIKSWRILGKYMLENKMINIFEFCRNMLAVRVFVYIPKNFKKIIYKLILRK